MSAPLRCAVCEVELTVADADHLVSTDAGPVHRECFEGPLPPSAELTAEDQAALERAEEEAENDRRREHGDPPMPPADDDDVVMLVEPKMTSDLHGGDEQLARYQHALTGRFPCTPHSAAGARGSVVHEAFAAALMAPGITGECRQRRHDLCPVIADCGCPCHAPAPDDGLDRRDPEDERGLREAREDELQAGRYDDDGRTF